MQQPLEQASSSWYSAVISGFLGSRPVFNGWQLLGGIAGLCVSAAMFTGQPGFLNFADVLDFFHLPGGAGDFVRDMNSWAADTFSTTLGAAFLTLLFLGCFIAMAFNFESHVVPSSPSPATFWVALLFSQSAGFANLGWTVFLCILGVLDVCRKFWSFQPLAMALIEPFIVLLSPAAVFAQLLLNRNR
ncbi:hypothetical protein E3O25_05515 [Cryobacterium sp. TMT1-3]|uniref:hypothetical protein n=1 Tax=Cryobacterium sp. TMT1-3 TaxID=1259237 RepID=UPI00106CB534|nr:hypothetical protein [Cryobacterium sp. TMT1-3]TFC29114.1 hypothetical protein E3O25_05515 [Cryobacterium sp. TMT1-3]